AASYRIAEKYPEAVAGISGSPAGAGSCPESGNHFPGSWLPCWRRILSGKREPLSGILLLGTPQQCARNSPHLRAKSRSGPSAMKVLIVSCDGGLKIGRRNPTWNWEMGNRFRERQASGLEKERLAG